MIGTGRSRTSRYVIAMAAAVLGVPVAVVGAGATAFPPDAAPSRSALVDIPPAMLALYQQAAAGCPGLPWPVLAGIGKVESDHNRPAGQVSDAGARGPMQFLLTTWAQYGADGNADGTADPDDPADAVPAAARYLCGHGAATDLQRAVAAYLCGASRDCQWQAAQAGGYVTRVLAWAARYTDPAGPAGPAATIAVQVALAQLGTPYRWGGQTPDSGFDCSGLVQFAYAHAGLALPRTAQTQYDTALRLPAGAALQPGDLVFFGASPGQISHVGIALGDGRMVDAPHTGAVVRVEPIAGFGSYQGATRPAITPLLGGAR